MRVQIVCVCVWLGFLNRDNYLINIFKEIEQVVPTQDKREVSLSMADPTHHTNDA